MRAPNQGVEAVETETGKICSKWVTPGLPKCRDHRDAAPVRRNLLLAVAPEGEEEQEVVDHL